MKKRLLSLFLALVMVLSLMPTVALADSTAISGATTISSSGSYYLNATIDGNIEVAENCTVTLDLNNQTVNGIIKNHGTLTITGEGTVNDSGEGYYMIDSMTATYGKTYIQGGTYVAVASGTRYIAANSQKKTEITGGTFVNCNNISFMSVDIKGGTFDKDISDKVAAGYKCVQDGANYKVVEDIKPVQIVNGQSYATIGAAMAEVHDGDTIKILADFEEPYGADAHKSNYLYILKNITLDLNGHTVTFTGSNYMKVRSTMTIKATNGGQMTGSTSLIMVEKGGNLTIESGTYTCSSDNVIKFGSNGETGVSTYGSLTVNGGTFINNKSTSSGYIIEACTYGLNVLINGGTFTSNSHTDSCAVYANNSKLVELKITGGSFNGSKAAIKVGTFCPQDAKVTITGGNFTSTSGDTIYDLNTAGKIIYSVTGGNYDANNNIQGFIDTENYMVADNTDTATKDSYPKKVTEKLVGFDFAFDANGGTGDAPAAPAAGNYGENYEINVPECTYTYEGKYFDHWNTAADGSGTTYIPRDKFNLTANTTLYAIWTDANNVAEVDGTKYASLVDAFAVANGKTVKVLKDFTVPAYETASYITVPQGNTVTLDLNGYTITTAPTKASADSLITNNGDLTITDTSAAKDGAIEYTAEHPWWWTIPNIPAEATDEQVEKAVSDSYVGSYVSNIISNYGSVTVEAGRLTNKSVESSAGYAIDCYGDACVTVNGGTVEAYCASAIRMFNSTNKAVATVTGGTIGRVESFSDSDYATTNRSYFGLQFMGGNATANVSGGKILGRYGIGSTVGNKLPRNTYNISGGEIEGTFYVTKTPDDKTMYHFGGAIAPMQYGKDTFNITGGIFQDHNQGLELFGDVNITDGEFRNIIIYQRYFTLKDDPWQNHVNISGGHFLSRVTIKSTNTPTVAPNYISITGGFYDGDIFTYAVDDFGKDTGESIKCLKKGYFQHDESSGSPNWSKAIAEGYSKVNTPSSDPNFSAGTNTFFFTVAPLEVVVDNEQIAAVVSTATDSTGAQISAGDAEKATTAVSNMMNNSDVSMFTGTNIDAATSEKDTTSDGFVISMVLNALIEQAKTDGVDDSAAASGNGKITVKEKQFVDEVVDKRLNIELKTAKLDTSVAVQGSETTIATVNGATFEVKPKATITIATGNVFTTVTTDIPNEAITKPIKFRLPVDENIKADTTAVWHSNDLSNPKKDYLGVYDIKTGENGKKYIELSADNFSFYTLENMTSITDSTVAVIIDNLGNSYGCDSLTEALAAFNPGADDSNEATVDNAVSIILMKNVTAGAGTEGATFDFGSKTMTFDLNGHKFIANPETGYGVNNAANVTLVNNDPTFKVTLGATGTYANDVSAFVADGFDVKTTTVTNDTVFNNTAAGVFSVVVVPVDGSYTDRDSETDDIDLYAGDTIKMDVRVYGAKFVGADVTLYYDKTNFKMTDAPTSGWDGDVKWYDGDDASKLNGKTRFYAAKSTQGGASSYYELNKTDGDVKYYSLGTFEFEALPGADEALNVAFQVEPTVEGQIGKTTDVAPVYVAGAWSQGWNSSPANKLTQGAEDTHLVNALVNVRLKSMSAVVNGETSLVYNATARNLVKSGAGAKDSISQQAIPNPTIKYAVLTKAEADGTIPLKNDSGEALYYTTEAKTETSTTVTDWPAYVAPKVPADTDYTDTIPQKTNAGDYVVFYRVSKDGYITVADKLNVSIAKKKVDLNWTATELTKADGQSNDYVSDFKVTYDLSKSETGFTAPVATYKDAGSNADLTADPITLTSYNDATPEENTKLFKVGKYVYTATVDPNYEITSGETCTVEVEGKTMQGYKLIVPGTQDSPSTIGSVWYDGEDHVPAILDKAEVADPDVPNVTYYVLKPGEHDWVTVALEDMKFKAAGTYQVKAVLTADNYYDLTTDTVTFTIKSATYVTEKFDWVTGWDVVLVYTNDIVPGFTYDGAMMYDVSKLGYKYGTTKNADGTVGTQAYTHVFGLVIAGDADITKVKSSNETALGINYSKMSNNTQGGVAWARLDVNSSTSVELLDLVFVQGVYNVNETYRTQQMANVLKSDVNGDKMVDTRDCALIKANS